MSKGLEALKQVKIRCHSKCMKYDPIDFDLNIIEEELEVLEILKTKQVDINFFKTLIPHYKTIEELQSAYNMSFVQWAKLTLDETKIIKEWLENESVKV